MHQSSPGSAPTSHRSRLQDIARRAMANYGLQPGFSPAALAQAREAQPHDEDGDGGAAVRDQRDLLWASIDNDDSRDLDQLSVSAPDGDGRVRILVAVADVDATVPAGSAVD